MRGKVSKKYSKIFFSEFIRRMKLNLGIHAYDITLYKCYVFIVTVLLLSLQLQLKVSIDLKWDLNGKVEICDCCCLIWDISFFKLSSPPIVI